MATPSRLSARTRGSGIGNSSPVTGPFSGQRAQRLQPRALCCVSLCALTHLHVPRPCVLAGVEDRLQAHG